LAVGIGDGAEESLCGELRHLRCGVDDAEALDGSGELDLGGDVFAGGVLGGDWGTTSLEHGLEDFGDG
jgi:hypothetical protein